ncbi:MAG TPA: SEC-C domain-containing protein [Terriglobales bacterium]|nr:SEC-C domain-containing protein [Terriglobales bacterium]
MMKKIRRNDPCWCESGKKYKKCHLNRELETPIPLGAIEQRTIAESNIEICLHPSASPEICDKIVSAHTIQRSRVLGQITDSGNHVQTFHCARTDYSVDGPRVLRVGWKEASTFTGFCSRHDSLTFRALEAMEFEGSLEQCFLVGYRALCYEIHQKSRMLKSQPIFLNLVDRGLPIEAQREIQEIGSVQEAGLLKGREDLLLLKSVMDEQLLRRAYSGWHRIVINFKGPLCMASTGAVSPNRDFDGTELQVLHNADALIQELLFGIVAGRDGGAAVFLCRAGDAAPQAFIESLLKRDSEMLGSLIVQFAFAYIENTFFSKDWWESLSEVDRKHLSSLAWVSNAYYEDFTYSRSRKIIPWGITSAVVNDLGSSVVAGINKGHVQK